MPRSGGTTTLLHNNRRATAKARSKEFLSDPTFQAPLSAPRRANLSCPARAGPMITEGHSFSADSCILQNGSPDDVHQLQLPLAAANGPVSEKRSRREGCGHGGLLQSDRKARPQGWGTAFFEHRQGETAEPAA